MTAYEEWRPVADQPGYFVSDLGRLASTRQGAWRVLKPRISDRGYRTHSFPTPNGVRKTRYVHQLVANAFNGTRPTDDGCYEVRHLNGDKLDNRAVNVLWDRASENRYDLVRHGVHPQARKTHCPSGHPYNEDNVYVLPSRPTARYCRPCQLACRRRLRRERRGNVPLNYEKTHCKRGHPFDEVNTYVYRNHRQCRQCKRDWDAKRALRAANVRIAA